MIGVVSSLAQCDDGTELALRTVAGPRRVCVQAVADAAGAARVRQALHRCLSVELTATGDASWSSTVRGVGHRRPVTVPVPTSTALALIAQGLPSVVRLP